MPAISSSITLPSTGPSTVSTHTACRLLYTTASTWSASLLEQTIMREQLPRSPWWCGPVHSDRERLALFYELFVLRTRAVYRPDAPLYACLLRIPVAAQQFLLSSKSAFSALTCCLPGLMLSCVLACSEDYVLCCVSWPLLLGSGVVCLSTSAALRSILTPTL